MQGLRHHLLDCSPFSICDDSKLPHGFWLQRINWKRAPRKFDNGLFFHRRNNLSGANPKILSLRLSRKFVGSHLPGRGGPSICAELRQRFYVILSEEYLLLSKTKRRPPDANSCRPNQAGAAKKCSADPLLCYLRRGITALLPIRATKSGSRDRKICETTRV
jgi:hypothetical protein